MQMRVCFRPEHDKCPHRTKATRDAERLAKELGGSVMTLDYIMTKYGLSEEMARKVTSAQLAECDWLAEVWGWPPARKTLWLMSHVDGDWIPWGSLETEACNQPVLKENVRCHASKP